MEKTKAKLTHEADVLNAIDNRKQLEDRYLTLTNSVLPKLAKSKLIQSPVTDNHCFQRIVLDTVCCGQWQNYLCSPAYRYLSFEQLAVAIAICEDIIAGRRNLEVLHRKSLEYRKRQNQSQLSLY